MEHFEKKITPRCLYNQFRVKQILVEVLGEKEPDFVAKRVQECIIEYNTDTSVRHSEMNDNIVRTTSNKEDVELQNKESVS